MSSASDISNLFEVAGGSPSQYLEVERTEQIRGSRGRWSMPAEQPELLPAAPVEPAQADAACAADSAYSAHPADLADTVSDAAQPQVACPVPAVVSEPPPALPAESGQPAVSAMPAAVVAGPPPVALSSVFARLLARNEPPADMPRRGTP